MLRDVLQRFVPAAALLGVGAAFALSPPFGLYAFGWGAAIAAGGLLFTRRSAMAQMLARGTAWSVVLPVVYATILTMAHGGFVLNRRMLFPALAATVALVLSRPMLSSDEAKATFAPVALRSWFLAAATAAIALGLTTTQFASALMGTRLISDAFAFGALGVSLVASGIGVARMRAWGIAAGALASVIALGFLAAPYYGLDAAMLAMLVPGAMMVGGVVAARAGIGHGSRIRVAESGAETEAEAGAETESEAETEAGAEAEWASGNT